MLNIYVASSWKNEFQPEVVQTLRKDGHEVYDFKDSEGFHWSEVDPDYKSWVSDVSKYIAGLDSPYAERGFARDMQALDKANACVMVMPCGLSAGLELGYAVGHGKITIVYIPAISVPDLMIKMADLVTNDLNSVRLYLKTVSVLKE